MKGKLETVFSVLCLAIEEKDLTLFIESQQNMSVEEKQYLKTNVARLHSLLNQGKSEKDHFPNGEGTSDQRQDPFLLRIHEVLEANYKNHLFGVKDLSTALLLSRSQLFRKLKGLTSTTPNNFIRSYRLNKAKELLLEEDRNATNVSYLTGFNNPNYFFKCFKDEFGMTPGQYLERLKIK